MNYLFTTLNYKPMRERIFARCIRIQRCITLILLGAMLFSCSKSDDDGGNNNGSTGQNNTPTETGPTQAEKYGITYLYDEKYVPKIHVEVTLEEWNSLLAAYDKDKNTNHTIHCDVKYVKGTEITTIKDAGLRIRGRATRKRPEGKTGEMHKSVDTDWNRCHFQINFRKFVKDDAHTVHGARKILLRWNHADPTYVREVFSYDLFRRAGAFTGTNAAHCRLYIKVEGDPKETYYGVYAMVEPIDDEYVKVRKNEFGSSTGNLWKCRHKATLSPDSNYKDANIGKDNDNGKEYMYELKTNLDDFVTAKAQLNNFITQFNTLEGKAFKEWIQKACDVRLLLRTYAVNVCLGMWDDYWNNRNNFYIYFNSTDRTNYKFYFIPFDYDNSLGNCSTRNDNEDQGRHDPFNWGPKDRPLIWKIIQIEEFRKMYAEELMRVVNDAEDLMHPNDATKRVQRWQARIAEMIKNDTGEDCKMEDRPTGGSTHKEYKLATINENNFFKVKRESVLYWCDYYGLKD